MKDVGGFAACKCDQLVFSLVVTVTSCLAALAMS